MVVTTTGELARMCARWLLYGLVAGAGFAAGAFAALAWKGWAHI